MKLIYAPVMLSLALILTACGGNDDKPAAASTQAAAVATPPAPPALARHDLAADAIELERKQAEFDIQSRALRFGPTRAAADAAIAAGQAAIDYAKARAQAYKTFPYEIFTDAAKTQVAPIHNEQQFAWSPARRQAAMMEHAAQRLEQQKFQLQQYRDYALYQ